MQAKQERDDSTFAQDLRAEMDRRGLRPEHVGVAVDVSATTVYTWLAGKKPAYDKYVKLCEFFGWPHFELGDRKGRRSVHSTKKGATRAMLDASSPASPRRGDDPESQSPDEDRDRAA